MLTFLLAWESAFDSSWGMPLSFEALLLVHTDYRGAVSFYCAKVCFQAYLSMFLAICVVMNDVMPCNFSYRVSRYFYSIRSF